MLGQALEHLDTMLSLKFPIIELDSTQLLDFTLPLIPLIATVGLCGEEEEVDINVAFYGGILEYSFSAP